MRLIFRRARRRAPQEGVKRDLLFITVSLPPRIAPGAHPPRQKQPRRLLSAREFITASFWFCAAVSRCPPARLAWNSEGIPAAAAAIESALASGPVDLLLLDCTGGESLSLLRRATGVKNSRWKRCLRGLCFFRGIVSWGNRHLREHRHCTQ